MRPLLDLVPDSHFLGFIEVGYALRACLEDKSRRDYLLQRLRPHLGVMIGTLPASIQPHGMLPKQPAPPGFRDLEQISDAEVRVEDMTSSYWQRRFNGARRVEAAQGPVSAGE